MPFSESSHSVKIKELMAFTYISFSNVKIKCVEISFETLISSGSFFYIHNPKSIEETCMNTDDYINSNIASVQINNK